MERIQAGGTLETTFNLETGWVLNETRPITRNISMRNEPSISGALGEPGSALPGLRPSPGRALAGSCPGLRTCTSITGAELPYLCPSSVLFRRRCQEPQPGSPRHPQPHQHLAGPPRTSPVRPHPPPPSTPKSARHYF